MDVDNFFLLVICEKSENLSLIKTFFATRFFFS
jgi:hypothetical protein